ncbi:MAG TPA: DUF5987 family protein [Thermoleophilaceae bacterium]|jgi:hypothetical protein
MDPREEHARLLDDLSRRGFLQRAGTLGLGGIVLAAVPAAERLIAATNAEALVPLVSDSALQAFADTMIPGRKTSRTDLGNAVQAGAIAGVDKRPGAVEADALALYRHPLIGFNALEPAFLADLNARSLQQGGTFVSLSFAKRVEVCKGALAFSNPDRLVWEAAAAVPFTAFCAAALIPEQTAKKASGYRVMGLPGAAPHGYRRFSYRKKLSKERTRRGWLK